MTHETTRRERRIAARRQQILDAAARIFAEKGLEGATTKEIADAADIAEGTLYNYFKSKNDLVIAIIEQLAQFEQRSAMMQAALDEDPLTFFVRHFSDRMAQVGPSYPLILASMPAILSSPELRQHYQELIMTPAVALIEQHLLARVERGQLRAVDMPLVTRGLVGMLLGIHLMLVLGDPLLTAAWQQPEALITTLADMLVHGLQTPPEDA